MNLAGADGAVPVYVLGLPCYAAVGDGDIINSPQRRTRLNDIAQEVVRHTPGSHFLDLTQLTCDRGDSISPEHAALMFRDGLHWSQTGARTVWAALIGRWIEDGQAWNLPAPTMTP